MKEKFQDIAIFTLLGLIIYGIGYNYTRPVSEVKVSHANLLVDETTNIPITSVISNPVHCDTEYQDPGLELGKDWNSR